MFCCLCCIYVHKYTHTHTLSVEFHQSFLNSPDLKDTEDKIHNYWCPLNMSENLDIFRVVQQGDLAFVYFLA